MRVLQGHSRRPQRKEKQSGGKSGQEPTGGGEGGKRENSRWKREQGCFPTPERVQLALCSTAAHAVHSHLDLRLCLTCGCTWFPHGQAQSPSLMSSCHSLTLGIFLLY